MRPLLSCFFLILGKVDLENVSPSVRWNLRGIFERFSPDGKYRVQYCKNLQLPIQMQVSDKRKTFSQIFVPLLEATSNFKHFEKEDDCHSLCVSQITDWKALLHHSVRSVVLEDP